MSFKIIECPRDAMQGLSDFIPTKKKIDYINNLLKVGFNTLDFGSFVSPKAVPQLSDTKEVIKGLNPVYINKPTKLLAIVANERGAKDAVLFDEITYLGYPLSISETFQKRNTGKNITDSYGILDNIISIANEKNKVVVVYLSMGFGNPYNDPYSSDIVLEFVERLASLGIKIVSIADTVGLAENKEIFGLLDYTIKEFPLIEIGAHLHSTPSSVKSKVQSVIDASCFRIDGAILGYGGCPFAEDELVGNLSTELIVSCLNTNKISHGLKMEKFNQSLEAASIIFH